MLTIVIGLTAPIVLFVVARIYATSSMLSDLQPTAMYFRCKSLSPMAYRKLLLTDVVYSVWP